ncbi:sensor histidine kinase [Anaerococcus vaginalis]|uniref:sensor histidine kinase n=1 Tax=Anaerococcus vaginalis TaxID=33037 RepID=UPI00242EABDA|nr:sensor histidine kinase [Anaerococcus vaginalis]MDU4379342.1 sensor histidine kinase [Anaerococcus vaginalis]MDU5559876.1 sensor histidine kinase [Anaerococcus vaginalis]MDU5988448.1 sensor histidine kinase [Anaerococcus vaginalis]
MKKIFKKIEFKISACFFVISILIISLMLFSWYKQSSSKLMTYEKEETSQEVKNASIYVASYLEKNKNLASLLAMSAESQNIMDDKTDFKNLKDIIKVSEKSDEFIKKIFLVSENGNIISNEKVNLETNKDMKNISWYKKLINSNNMAFASKADFSKISSDSSKNIISISKEIKDKNNKRLGFVVINLSYKFLEDFLSTINFGKDGYVFILSSEEELLFKSKNMEDFGKKDYEKLLKKRMKPEKMDFVSSNVFIPNTQWKLVGISFSNAISNLKKQLIESSLILALIVFILTLLVSIFVSKKISKPIIYLIGEIKKTDKKLYKIKSLPQASSEIQILTKEYNNLIDRIFVLTEDIEKKEEQKRTYQVKALQSQINPHFLYNTLDTILWLVEFGENEKAIKVTKNLGMLLRNSLNIDEDFVKLDKEIEHAKNYLDIQKIRYDNKFTYEFIKKIETSSLYVPKLILQPIIENAIYHGIREKKSKSYIKIIVEKNPEYLIIKIIDNGLGPKEKKENIPTKLGGIGMENVNNRIKLLCGEKYNLKMQREKDETIVTYKLKIIKEI